jgi:hypothetical protein
MCALHTGSIPTHPICNAPFMRIGAGVQANGCIYSATAAIAIRSEE